MFSHVFVGVSDFGQALAFYRPVLAALKLQERFCEPDRPWAGWQIPGVNRPLFLIGRPFDGQPHSPGNGQMAAFLADGRAQVHEVHRLALSLGALDDGSPGLRPEYHPHYYGAYFRDPDGNKICVACHQPSA